MRCRFCGEEVKTMSSKTLWGRFGDKCKTSTTGFHVAVSDGINCVYCGEAAKPSSSGKLLTRSGPQCRNSPTKAHALQ